MEELLATPTKTITNLKTWIVVFGVFFFTKNNNQIPANLNFCLFVSHNNKKSHPGQNITVPKNMNDRDGIAARFLRSC